MSILFWYVFEGWMDGGFVRTGPGFVFCRGAQEDGVAGGGEGVVEGSDVDFGPAVVVGEDDV